MLSNGLTSIGSLAFGDCSSLSSVNIPSSVTTIGNSAFRQSTSLASFSVDPNNPYFVSISGVIYNKSVSTLVEVPGGFSGNFTIPSSVTSIGDGAVSSCAYLTSITIPNGLKSIGNSAFYMTCVSSISIPSTVTTIAANAFYGSNNLTSVTIPLGVESIGDFAFAQCANLANVSIASSVNSIGNYVFFECPQLSNVTIQSVTPPSLPSSSYTFTAEASGFEIHVPSSTAVSAYDAATGWCSYASEIVTP